MIRFSALCITLLSISSFTYSAIEHGIAMHGTLKYPDNFSSFDYANPNAPKGGTLVEGIVSSSGFDSLNPFISKGIAAAGIYSIYDTLMESSKDEAFSKYGLAAQGVELPADRSWVIFHLNPKAVFHDGHPMTSEDVIYSFNILLEQGRPFYRYYFAGVERVEALDKSRVKFTFKPGVNRELPLILGEVTVLPKHYWKDKDFSRSTLVPPLGSGPYKIVKVDPGRSITYERVKNYWGKDLAINKGRYNPDTIIYDYYLDATVALQAFKAGEFDFRLENTAISWATAYDIKSVTEGAIIIEEIPHQLPAGMQGFAYNTRNPLFSDPLVRQALAYAFDFEWTNKHLMYNAYKRTNSYFANSELAASELPSQEELEILSPFKSQLPPEVFTQAYLPPQTDGSGSNRKNLRTAMQLLKQAGWEIQNNQLVNKQGELFSFEILLNGPSFEGHTQAFTQNLKKLGVQASIRPLNDTQQYVNRLRSFDFDMVVGNFGQSLSPGNEQRDYWSSSSATRKDSRNLIGVNNPVVDQLIEQLIASKDREQLINQTKALDRVLQWGYYVIPQWHYDKFRLARWQKVNRPENSPPYGIGIDTWWLTANPS